MKGIILAGGNGTRLRPMTNVTNKHLISVYDRPMIEYPLKTLTKAGITDILIVSGREHAGHFLEYLGSGADRGLKFTYKVQEDAGGIAQALGLAKDFAAGEPVCVILGDNYFDAKILPEAILASDALIFLKQVPDPQRFGVANVSDGKITEIVEKPKEFISDLAVTGLYVFPSDVFDVVSTLKPSQRGELEITDVVNFYLKQNRLGYFILDQFWSDMGTPDSLARTINYIISKK